MGTGSPWFAAVLGLLVGCAEIAPASLGGGDEGDDDGNEDGGDPEPGAVRPDGGDQVNDGEAPTCDFEAASASDKLVRVLYMVPSDRDEDAAYTANLEQAVRHAQQWIRARLPAAAHFTVADPVVQVAQTTHPAAWYQTNVNGDDVNLYFWNNTLADAGNLGAALDDPDNVWLIYIAADPACGQATYGTQHLAVFPENDLRGVAGVPRINVCGGATDGYGRCRWVGGMALLMGFALGLPGEPGCADADAATPCDDAGLTRYGYISYPSANLTEAQVSYLADSPFMTGSGLPACELDCAVALTH
jgi:hypothetical protein